MAERSEDRDGNDGGTAASPHGEVDFMQSTRIIGSKDGSDFIGYYHVPKRGTPLPMWIKTVTNYITLHSLTPT